MTHHRAHPLLITAPPQPLRPPIKFTIKWSFRHSVPQLFCPPASPPGPVALPSTHLFRARLRFFLVYLFFSTLSPSFNLLSATLTASPVRLSKNFPSANRLGSRLTTDFQRFFHPSHSRFIATPTSFTRPRSHSSSSSSLLDSFSSFMPEVSPDVPRNPPPPTPIPPEPLHRVGCPVGRLALDL